MSFSNRVIVCTYVKYPSQRSSSRGGVEIRLGWNAFADPVEEREMSGWREYIPRKYRGTERRVHSSSVLAPCAYNQITAVGEVHNSSARSLRPDVRLDPTVSSYGSHDIIIEYPGTWLLCDTNRVVHFEV